MFAIIEESGHQLRVQDGETITVDYRADAQVGDAITFDRVLLAGSDGKSSIGAPLLSGASVTGTVVNPLEKGPKLEIQKFRRRKTLRRHTGHRQKYTTVKITGISAPGL